MIDLTIGIPCYNEALTIGKVVGDFGAAFPEARLLVIDNASTDGTARIAREHGAEVITEPRKGKGNAVQRLFQETSSDYLLMVDGDDTYPATEAHKLITTLREEGATRCAAAGCRPTARRSKARTSGPIICFPDLSRWCSGFRAGTCFPVTGSFTRRFYRHVPLIATGFEVEAELVMQTIDKRFVQRNVDVLYRSRPADSFSKLQTLPDGTRVIWTLLTIIKDCKPLPFFSLLSLALLVACLLAGWFPIHDYLRHRYVYHVPLAILATGLSLLSALSLSCGLLLDTIVRHRKEEFFLRMRGQERESNSLNRVD